MNKVINSITTILPKETLKGATLSSVSNTAGGLLINRIQPFPLFPISIIGGIAGAASSIAVQRFLKGEENSLKATVLKIIVCAVTTLTLMKVYILSGFTASVLTPQILVTLSFTGICGHLIQTGIATYFSSKSSNLPAPLNSSSHPPSVPLLLDDTADNDIVPNSPKSSNLLPPVLDSKPSVPLLLDDTADNDVVPNSPKNSNLLPPVLDSKPSAPSLLLDDDDIDDDETLSSSNSQYTQPVNILNLPPFNPNVPQNNSNSSLPLSSIKEQEEPSYLKALPAPFKNAWNNIKLPKGQNARKEALKHLQEKFEKIPTRWNQISLEMQYAYFFLAQELGIENFPSPTKFPKTEKGFEALQDLNIFNQIVQSYYTNFKQENLKNENIKHIFSLFYQADLPPTPLMVPGITKSMMQLNFDLNPNGISIKEDFSSNQLLWFAQYANKFKDLWIQTPIEIQYALRQESNAFPPLTLPIDPNNIYNLAKPVIQEIYSSFDLNLLNSTGRFRIGKYFYGHKTPTDFQNPKLFKLKADARSSLIQAYMIQFFYSDLPYHPKFQNYLPFPEMFKMDLATQQMTLSKNQVTWLTHDLQKIQSQNKANSNTKPAPLFGLLTLRLSNENAFKSFSPSSQDFDLKEWKLIPLDKQYELRMQHHQAAYKLKVNVQDRDGKSVQEEIKEASYYPSFDVSNRNAFEAGLLNMIKTHNKSAISYFCNQTDLLQSKNWITLSRPVQEQLTAYLQAYGFEKHILPLHPQNAFEVQNLSFNSKKHFAYYLHYFNPTIFENSENKLEILNAFANKYMSVSKYDANNFPKLFKESALKYPPFTPASAIWTQCFFTKHRDIWDTLSFKEKIDVQDRLSYFLGSEYMIAFNDTKPLFQTPTLEEIQNYPLQTVRQVNASIGSDWYRFPLDVQEAFNKRFLDCTVKEGSPCLKETHFFYKTILEKDANQEQNKKTAESFYTIYQNYREVWELFTYEMQQGWNKAFKQMNLTPPLPITKQPSSNS